MSSVYSLDISPELKEYLVERGQLTKVGDKYLPALMTQRIFDGVVKTRHYIYPAWRNMLDANQRLLRSSNTLATSGNGLKGKSKM